MRCNKLCIYITFTQARIKQSEVQKKILEAKIHKRLINDFVNNIVRRIILQNNKLNIYDLCNYF